MHQAEDLSWETDPDEPRLLWVTLQREQSRNAWSDGMLLSFIAALDEAERRDDIWAVAVTGAGSAFSAGGDLKAMRDATGMFAGDSASLRERYRQGIQAVPRRLATFDKPVIAAINGAAIGAGLDLACMCDLRIASERARFGSTFVRVGLVPGDGGAYFLSRAVGYARALELALTARIVDAEEALQLGLIQQRVAPEELRAATRSLAQRIFANGPQAVRLTKSAFARSWDLGWEASLELAATYQGIAQRSAEHREGVAAMLERRPPRFGESS